MIQSSQRPDAARPSGWVSPVAAIAAGFTAACCLGASAAVSLATALGASFFTSDATLRPMLAVTLAMTVAGSALTYWRRRRIGPLTVTAVSAVWIYSFVFVIGRHAGRVADPMAGHHAGRSTGRLAAVSLGLGLLVSSQVSDVTVARRRRTP